MILVNNNFIGCKLSNQIHILYIKKNIVSMRFRLIQKVNNTNKLIAS